MSKILKFESNNKTLLRISTWRLICSQFVILIPLKIRQRLSKVHKHFWCVRNVLAFFRETFYLSMLTLLLSSCSVLWLDVMSIAGGRRLSAFGCQNGCVGLALVDQSQPGEAQVTWSSCLLLSWSDVLIAFSTTVSDSGVVISMI